MVFTILAGFFPANDSDGSTSCDLALEPIVERADGSGGIPHWDFDRWQRDRALHHISVRVKSFRDFHGRRRNEPSCHAVLDVPGNPFVLEACKLRPTILGFCGRIGIGDGYYHPTIDRGGGSFATFGLLV